MKCETFNYQSIDIDFIYKKIHGHNDEDNVQK